MGKTFHQDPEDFEDAEYPEYPENDDPIGFDDQPDESMDGDHESALESVYGPEDYDEPPDMDWRDDWDDGRFDCDDY